MIRVGRPAIDRAIVSASGTTRDGQPLSYSRAPAADLAPWVSRVYAAMVEAPADHRLECGLFNDTTFLRIQLCGDWTAQTAHGPRQMGRAALFFGPQTRRMPIAVRGGFTSIGVALRSGASQALGIAPEAAHMDSFAPLDELGLPGQRWLDLCDVGASAEDFCCAMEGELRAMIGYRRAPVPDAVTARFEAAAYADPTLPVGQLARDLGVELRRLERIVRRDFGLSPKQVLRRARALDMASHLRGVADHDEAEALMLRYYDQSHLIREFTEKFGMGPRQFVDTPQPLMTLALETRQARRLEMIERIAPGGIRPWE